MKRASQPRGSALALALCAFASCTPAREAELLEVRGVAPDRVEPGHTLRVRGDGFPPGRSARVRIEGVAHRPGFPPRDVEVELRGRAASSEQVEASFTEQALDELGGRATIRGRATVIFDATPEGAVIGRSPSIVLDVAPASTSRLAEELARRRSAIELVSSLGISLGEEGPDEPGLPVETVGAESPAARAGLVTGDRLLALHGLRLHTFSDFLVAPGEESALVEVAREGEAAPFPVSIEIARRSGLAPRTIRTGQAALGWLLLVFFLVAPTASLVDRFAARSAHAPRERFWRRIKRWVPFVLRSCLGVAFFAAIVVLDRADLLRVPLEAIALGALAARTSAAYVSRPRGEPFASRLRAVAGALAQAALAALAIGIACATQGTTELSSFDQHGGALPWEWLALRTPAGPFLVALLVAGGAWRPSGTAPAARLAEVVDETVALVLAAIAASMLLGGWQCDPSPLGRAAGAALFVAKGLVLWTLMRRIGAHDRPSISKYAAHSVLALAALAFALSSSLWPPDPILERALAEVLTAALVCTAIWMLGRRIVHGRPTSLVPAHPFL